MRHTSAERVDGAHSAQLTIRHWNQYGPVGRDVYVTVTLADLDGLIEMLTEMREDWQ